MIRYYAYYYSGGYKSMYLGDSSMKEEMTYFLPLLPHWEEKAQNGDEALISKVGSLSKLPKIQIFTNENSYDLPPEAKLVFSHRGFRMIYRRLPNGGAFFCVRDISGGHQGEPFSLLISASDSKDAKKLDAFVSYYALQNGEQFSSRSKKLLETLSSLFSHDSDANGTRFNLRSLNDLLGQDLPSDTCTEIPSDKSIALWVDDRKEIVRTVFDELEIKYDQIKSLMNMKGGKLNPEAYKPDPPQVSDVVNKETIKEGSDLALGLLKAGKDLISKEGKYLFWNVVNKVSRWL